MDAQRFLKELTSGQYYQEQIAFVNHIPSKAAEYGEVSPPLIPEVQQLLSDRGITQLYSHQTEAITEIRNGHHTVIVTGTASGKSLCFLIPALENFIIDPRSRALFLYPTKALAQDQLKALNRLCEGLIGPQPVMGTYDGDTSVNTRKMLRDQGNFVLTNPDMLHQGILPKHPGWSSFFSHLQFVIIDEIHS